MEWDRRKLDVLPVDNIYLLITLSLILGKKCADCAITWLPIYLKGSHGPTFFMSLDTWVQLCNSGRS